MDINKLLHDRRKEIGLTMREVADAVGVSETTVSRWESGNIKNMGRDKMALLSKVLKLNPSELMDWDDSATIFPPHQNILPIKTKKWRVLGDIACGEPIYANEDFDSYVEAGTDIPADFCVRAKGDSMINARINDGDIVFIREQPQVNNGEIAAVVVEDGVTLKRFYRHGDTVQLLAENPAYEPQVYMGDELNRIIVLGKAVAFQSDI